MAKYKMTDAELHRLDRMISNVDRYLSPLDEEELKKPARGSYSEALGIKRIFSMPSREETDYVYNFTSNVIPYTPEAKPFTMPNLGPEVPKETEAKPFTMPSFDDTPRKRVALTISGAKIIPAA